MLRKCVKNTPINFPPKKKICYDGLKMKGWKVLLLNQYSKLILRCFKPQLQLKIYTNVSKEITVYSNLISTLARTRSECWKQKFHACVSKNIIDKYSRRKYTFSILDFFAIFCLEKKLKGRPSYNFFWRFHIFSVNEKNTWYSDEQLLLVTP